MSEEMKRRTDWQRRKNQEKDCEIRLKEMMKVKSVYLRTNKCELIKTQCAEAAQELAEDEKHSDHSD